MEERSHNAYTNKIKKTESQLTVSRDTHQAKKLVHIAGKLSKITIKFNTSERFF